MKRFLDNMRRAASRPRRQTGVATLMVTLVILLILTVVILLSVNVGVFEQKTATNENRARLAEQAAEFAANLAGEYLKANRNNLIANTSTGWLSSGASRRWALCSSVGGMTASHPCMAEPDPTRRDQTYFYTQDGDKNGVQTLPYRSLIDDSIVLETTGVGGASAFATTTTVRALLCRIDTSLTTPDCRATPAAGNRIAITVLSQADIPGENASATVKQMWGTFAAASPSSAVPLVASGLIKGVGNATIVQNANAAGTSEGSGFQVSMWSPCEVDIEAVAPATPPSGCAAPAPGSSVGSVNTCARAEYLRQEDDNIFNDVAESTMLTTCAGNGTACGCPTFDSQDLGRSGHSGSTKQEGQDVLDRDSGHGQYPDIQFFPDAKYGLDKAADDTDDSLFEWIFGVNYESSSVANADSLGTGKGFTLQNCTVPATFDAGRPTNCAAWAMYNEFDATSIATCGSLDSASSGIYYVRGGCDLPNQVGSPNNFVIVVVTSNGTEVKFNGTTFYGLLFIRSDNDTAQLHGVGNSKVFGSVVVQGEVDIAGTIDIVYYDTSISGNPNVLPKTAKFGVIPGSWLDNSKSL
jgi:type II secretory pathway pseudopilin PulG